MEGQINVEAVRGLLNEFENGNRRNEGGVNIFRHQLRRELGLPISENSLGPVVETLEAAGAGDLVSRIETILDAAI
ncbi:MAG: hypothetical protein NTZ25_01835 [Candidatus Peregrinibacteria bacterium]|nr:hypothetical protein [Candidatus Peregrinibacteria bacterium]